MSKFDSVLKKISEALPVTPGQPQQQQPAVGTQPSTTPAQPKPVTPTTPVQAGAQNPAIQALAAAKTADDVAKILADPAHQQALQNFLQKK